MLETERLNIIELDLSMANDIHLNSLDEETRLFVPDELFNTIDDAKKTIDFLIKQYGKTSGPLVYALTSKQDKHFIGYVQAVPIKDYKWEIGYHINKLERNKGYATEAVKAFLPYITNYLNINTIYGIIKPNNLASKRVLEKTGFIYKDNQYLWTK